VSNDPAIEISNRLRADGYAISTANRTRVLLEKDTLSSWNAFAESWNHLSVDTYMADGGRYRRRRFAAFAVSQAEIVRKPHQPHYQSRDYNRLNGGIERWFDPVADAIAGHPVLLACLRECFAVFEPLTNNRPVAWHVEVHQFRIETHDNQQGLPTPEGLHRDGVDWVLVMLIARENIAEGVTTIHDLNKRALGSFTLTAPLDAAFVDDSRVYHGVTAVHPIDLSKPAYRDVLVVTFRRP
jgi:hypothetical protein